MMTQFTPDYINHMILDDLRIYSHGLPYTMAWDMWMLKTEGKPILVLSAITRLIYDQVIKIDANRIWIIR